MGTIAIMLKAFLLARFLSVLLLKEQMIISVKKIKTLVRSLQNQSIFCKICHFLQTVLWQSSPKIFLQKSSKIGLFFCNLSKALTKLSSQADVLRTSSPVPVSKTFVGQECTPIRTLFYDCGRLP